VAQGYQNNQMVGLNLFPPVMVAQRGGKIVAFGKEAFIRLFRERPRPLGRGGIADGAAVPLAGTVSAPLFSVTSPAT
jgi:hypothetical protein